jgi:hypothetical protein
MHDRFALSFFFVHNLFFRVICSISVPQFRECGGSNDKHAAHICSSKESRSDTGASSGFGPGTETRERARGHACVWMETAEAESPPSPWPAALQPLLPCQTRLSSRLLGSRPVSVPPPFPLSARLSFLFSSSRFCLLVSVNKAAASIIWPPPAFATVIASASH